MTIGERIKSRRLELGLSVDDIAYKLKKNRATIYRYESDDIENLPITILEPLANALETSPAYLMGWDNSENTYSDYDELGSFYGEIKKDVFRIRLNEIIKECNVSIVDLSKLLDVNVKTINDYLSGKSCPLMPTLLVLAQYFNINIGWLMGHNDDKYQHTLNLYTHNSDSHLRDSSVPYYLDSDARNMAQEIYENPDLRILFDASRKLAKEDIKAVVEIVNRLKNKDN